MRSKEGAGIISVDGKLLLATVERRDEKTLQSSNEERVSIADEPSTFLSVKTDNLVAAGEDCTVELDEDMGSLLATASRTDR